MSPAPEVPATEESVDVVVPEVLAGAARAWRKVVTGTNRADRGGWALHGTLVDPDRAYRITRSALLVAVDKVGTRWHIRLYRVDTGGLVEMQTWEQKSPLGKRVLDFVQRRLPSLEVAVRERELRWVPNRWAGRCRECHEQVPAGAGWWRRDEEGRGHIRHVDGACVPAHRRPPRRNRWAGRCWICRGWLEAEEGVVVWFDDDVDLLLLAKQGRWRPQHEGECPAVPAAPPLRRNDWEDWCRDCGELVPAGKGRFDQGVRHREDACPTPWEVDTWRIRRRGSRFEVGQTLLTTILPSSRRGESPVPDDAPGYLVLDERGFCEVAVTVVECRSGGRAHHHARVRVATWDEAASLLADRAGTAVGMRPGGHGPMAAWSAERYGTPADRFSLRPTARGCVTPWVAEIVGRDRTFGLRRDFLRPKVEYRHASRSGARGVWFHWSLSPNTVYEAFWPTSWRNASREFLRVTSDGDVEYVTREEVEAWLSAAPELIGS